MTSLEQAYDFYKTSARAIARKLIAQKVHKQGYEGFVISRMAVRRTCVVCKVHVLDGKGYKLVAISVTAQEIDQYIDYINDNDHQVPVPGSAK